MKWSDRTQTIGVLLATALALTGCSEAGATPERVPSITQTPDEPAPVAWEDHTTSLSCEGAVATDSYGYYGWSYDADANEWLQDEEPTVERSLSSLTPLTLEQELDLQC